MAAVFFCIYPDASCLRLDDGVHLEGMDYRSFSVWEKIGSICGCIRTFINTNACG